MSDPNAARRDDQGNFEPVQASHPQPMTPGGGNAGEPLVTMSPGMQRTHKLLIWGGLGMGCFGTVAMVVALAVVVWVVSRETAQPQPVALQEPAPQRVVPQEPAPHQNSVAVQAIADAPPTVDTATTDSTSQVELVAAEGRAVDASAAEPTVTPQAAMAEIVEGADTEGVTTETGKQENALAAEPPEPSFPKPAGVRPKYQFKAGDEFVYRIDVIADMGPAILKIDGECSYEVMDYAVQPHVESAGSGTGFVVTENGYLITCAHVVADAQRVNVTLDGKQYVGKVMAMDLEQDLAVVKIPADRLKPVSLTDSGRVQSTQDVYAVGYPLSDLLGKNIKVTRGAVAGVLDDVARKRFHIDAAINPGNSGGPVFDQRGGVVGVASAKVSGMDVSRVGLAIPSAAVRRLLDKHNISHSKSNQGSILSGPELVDKVTSSVALIEVSIDPNRYQLFRLKYSGEKGHKAESKDGGYASLPAGMYGTDRDSGYVTISQTGELVEFKGEVQMPFLLGPLGILPLENMNTHGETHWGTEVQSELTLYDETRSRQASLFFPFGRPQKRVKATYPAVESIQYALLSDEEDQITIRKAYEFRTLDDTDKPKQRHRGSGTLVFSKKLGMPESFDYRGTHELRNDNGQLVRIPLNVKYRLRDQAEIAEEKRQLELRIKKRQEEAEAERAERARKEAEREAELKKEETVPDPERVGDLVASLNSANSPPDISLLKELARRAVVEDLHDEVVASCKKILKASDNRAIHRFYSKVIISKYSPEQQIPFRVEQLHEDLASSSSRDWKAIMQTLGKLRNDESIAALAKCLTFKTWQSDALSELEAIGPAAEEDVLEVLQITLLAQDKVQDSETQRIVTLLRNIGTEKSIPFLEQSMAKLADDSLAFWLRVSRDAIRRRLQSVASATSSENNRLDSEGTRGNDLSANSGKPSGTASRGDSSSQAGTPGQPPSALNRTDQADGPERVADKRIRLSLKHQLQAPESRSRDLCFSPDGKWLASLHEKKLYVFEPLSGELKWEHPMPTPYGSSIAFSKDSKWLAVPDGYNLVVFDVASKSVRCKFRLETSSLRSIDFSPDGNGLALCLGVGKQIELLDLESQTKKLTISSKFILRNIRFSPDGKTLGGSKTGGEGGFVQYDVQTGTLLSTHETQNCFWIDYFPSGKYVVAASKNEVKCLRADNGKVMRTYDLERGQGILLCAKVVPSHRLLAVVAAFQKTFLVDLESGEPLSEVKNTLDRVAVSQDGKFLATVDENQSVQLWEMEVENHE